MASILQKNHMGEAEISFEVKDNNYKDIAEPKVYWVKE